MPLVFVDIQHTHTPLIVSFKIKYTQGKIAIGEPQRVATLFSCFCLVENRDLIPFSDFSGSLCVFSFKLAI